MFPIKTYLYAAALVAILAAGAYVKWLYSSRESYKSSAEFEQAEKVKAIQTIAKIQESANSDRKLLEGYQSVKSEIQYVDKIVTKEVIRYRERAVNRCELSPDWVRIHDQSAAGVHSADAAAGANDAPGSTPKAIDDAIALEVVTGNNRTCIADQEKLKALQAWASQLRQAQ